METQEKVTDFSVRLASFNAQREDLLSSLSDIDDNIAFDGSEEQWESLYYLKEAIMLLEDKITAVQSRGAHLATEHENN